jgi:hypothetical protein
VLLNAQCNIILAKTLKVHKSEMIFVQPLKLKQNKVATPQGRIQTLGTCGAKISKKKKKQQCKLIFFLQNQQNLFTSSYTKTVPLADKMKRDKNPVPYIGGTP